MSRSELTSDNLEEASLPTTTPEERRTLLSFVVCGGGPTGVEFAAEVADMLSEEALLYVSYWVPTETDSSTPSFSAMRSRSL